MLLNMVYNVAYSDGVFHQSESSLIDQLAILLKVSQFDHQRIKMAFEAQFGTISAQANDDKYYATLGLTNSATKDEIKKTYRDLTKKYHPDKVQHLGEEFRKTAESKMQEINYAYDELIKRVSK
jgi:DnaJ like chaperone protein